MNTSLIFTLLNRIPKFVYPNSRNYKPKERKEPNYFHKSGPFFVKELVGGVEVVKAYCVTYRKPAHE